MPRRVSLPSNPKVLGVGRMADNSKALLVCFDREPSDDDIRALHEALSPPVRNAPSFDPRWYGHEV